MYCVYSVLCESVYWSINCFRTEAEWEGPEQTVSVWAWGDGGVHALCVFPGKRQDRQENTNNVWKVYSTLHWQIVVICAKHVFTEFRFHWFSLIYRLDRIIQELDNIKDNVMVKERSFGMEAPNTARSTSISNIDTEVYSSR